MEAAASVCGISRRAVQAAKKAGCTAINQSRRVDCYALLAWLVIRRTFEWLRSRQFHYSDLNIILIKSRTLSLIPK
jgi:hypothetical protein